MAETQDRERCQACIDMGCESGYDFFESADSAGHVRRICMCCDQLWPSGELDPEIVAVTPELL